MFYDDFDLIQLVFVPSREEITEYNGDNTYYCGLDETRDSIQELINSAMNDFFKHGGKSEDPHFSEPRFDRINDRLSEGVHGAAPEVIFNVVITLATGGMGAAVYKLLDLWVKAKNGRKIHVKLPSGIVVDATQMTHSEFSEFLSEVHKVHVQHQKDLLHIEKLIKDKRLKQVSEEDNLNTLISLSTDVQKKKEQILSRPRRKKSE